MQPRIPRHPALLALASLVATAPTVAAQLGEVILLDEKNERAYRMVDLDGDRLYLSPGEVVEFVSFDLTVGAADADPEVIDMRLEGGVPTFYFVSNDGGAAVYVEGVWRGQDSNGDGVINAAELSGFFATSTQGWNINSEGLGLVPNGDVYFSSDFSAKQGIMVVRDLDASGDANGPGESHLLVDGGSGTGGPTIVVDTDLGAATGTINTADFDRMTTDGNGIVVYEGFASACTYSEDSLFRIEDKNQNGVLDAGEARLWLNYSGKNPTLPMSPDFKPVGSLPNMKLQSTSSSADPACAGKNNITRIRHLDSRVEGAQRAFYLLSDPNPGPFSLNVDGKETNGMVFRAVDNNGDEDVNDAGEVKMFYDGSSGSASVPASAWLGQCWSVAAGGDAIYVVDNTNRVFRLTDLNGDGDAHDQAVALPGGGTADEFEVGVFDYATWSTTLGAAPFVVGGGFGAPFISQILPLDSGVLQSPNMKVSGTACSFYGDLPEFAGVGIAVVGGSGFTAEIRNLPGGLPSVLIAGSNTSSWGGLPLPLDLSVFGWPGCNGYVDPLLLINTVSTGTVAPGATDGVASFPLTVPANPSFQGFVAPLQGLVVNILVLGGGGIPTVAFTQLGEVTIF